MAKDQMNFPTYRKTKQGLIAFMAPDKMVLIRNQGSNTNAGLIVDYYATRSMVLKHSKTHGQDISQKDFCNYYRALFEDALQFITQWTS